MRIGKVSEPVLKRSVLKEIAYDNPAVIKGAGVALDSGVFAVPEGCYGVATTDPITCVSTDLAEFAVAAVLNDMAVTGATATGLLVTALLPAQYGESDLKQLMRRLNALAAENEVVILGGHTETTTAVNRPVLSLTAVGYREKETVFDLTQCKPGMDIVMTKGIGIEATAILARERKAELENRFAPFFMDQCRDFIHMLSVVPECKIAKKMAAAAMHDVSEGGVLGALWELGACAQTGVEVDFKKIPVYQETIEVCEQFDLNPYGAIGGGAALFVTEDGAALKTALNAADIRAEVIGKITTGTDRVIINEGERRFLEPPKSDEISKLEGR